MYISCAHDSKTMTKIAIAAKSHEREVTHGRIPPNDLGKVYHASRPIASAPGKIYAICTARYALTFSTDVWRMGFHSTRLNSATSAMGIYVSMKTGKRGRYITFLIGLAGMFGHSTMTVSRP